MFTLRKFLLSHHGVKIGCKSQAEYLIAARYTISYGTKITYMYKGVNKTGYIRFLGHNGGANYAFVGMNGNNIATFGIRRVNEQKS
jgi:prepilin-type processing-associated H-X9-DG protein